jgi:hypothetical protein
VTSINKISKALEDFFELEPRNLQPLSGGTNNKVYKVQIGHENFIVKSYAESLNSVDRFIREYKFLILCERNRIDNVPVVKFTRKDLSIICETNIQGSKIITSSKNIESMINFVHILNSNIPFKDITLKATDFAFTSEDLLKSLSDRILKIKSKNLFDNEITTYFDELFTMIEHNELKFKSTRNFFSKFSRNILSPSDLGPENMISADKDYFIDFEYSGLDSNIKLGLDIVTRPSIQFEKLKTKHIEHLFLDVVGFDVHLIPPVLVQIFKLKWILIEYSSMMRRSVMYETSELDIEVKQLKLAVTEMIKNFTRV